MRIQYQKIVSFVWLLFLFIVGSVDCYGQERQELPTEPNASQTPLSVYDQGIAIMKEEGVKAGIVFFETHALETGSLRSLFGLAWGYWSEGELDDARLVCDYILSQEPHDVLKAHCYFLKGYIHLILQEYEGADRQLLQALNVYEEKQRYGDLFKTYLGLAASRILDQEFDAGRRYLDQALVINDKAERNPGYYYHLWSRLAFGEGNYQEALRHARQSYQAYKAINDEENMTNSLIDIALYLMLTGSFEEGVRITREAQEIIQKKDYVKWSYYNAINFILANRCSGLDSSEFEGKVRTWIEKKEDLYLESLLDFVLTCECP